MDSNYLKDCHFKTSCFNTTLLKSHIAWNSNHRPPTCNSMSLITSLVGQLLFSVTYSHNKTPDCNRSTCSLSRFQYLVYYFLLLPCIEIESIAYSPYYFLLLPEGIECIAYSPYVSFPCSLFPTPSILFLIYRLISTLLFFIAITSPPFFSLSSPLSSVFFSHSSFTPLHSHIMLLNYSLFVLTFFSFFFQYSSTPSSLFYIGLYTILYFLLHYYV